MFYEDVILYPSADLLLTKEVIIQVESGDKMVVSLQNYKD